MINGDTEHRSPSRLCIGRCAATGAVVATVLFLVCWGVVLFAPLAQSRMAIALIARPSVFTSIELAQELGCSILFGALAGALVAFFHNFFEARGRA